MGIITFKMNRKFQSIMKKIVSETIRCAKQCRLQLGQIRVEMLGLQEALVHLANQCILPAMNCYLDKSTNPIGIQDKRNKTKKNDYPVDGIVFYDGEKEMFENFVLSYAPDYWERPAVGSVRQLPEHEDDSDITINLCLGGDFSESSVIFDNGI